MSNEPKIIFDLGSDELNAAAEQKMVEKVAECGHTAFGNGFTYTCTKSEGHRGLHQETVQLRDSTSVTNWGDDSLAKHATRGRTYDDGRTWVLETWDR